MTSKLKRMISKIPPFAPGEPESERRIAKRGHRNYIGGMWDEIGQLQFDFLLSKGLKPDSYLLDIACGSLRLGVKAIPYLERGRYLGIEKERVLVEAGLEKELDPEIREAKQPNIVVSDSFEFERLAQRADFAIAQSLFTHIPRRLIEMCFKNLYPRLQDDGVFYATFFGMNRKSTQFTKLNEESDRIYSVAQMCGFGESEGFRAKYIGEWNHPRGQVIVEYRKN